LERIAVLDMMLAKIPPFWKLEKTVVQIFLLVRMLCTSLLEIIVAMDIILVLTRRKILLLEIMHVLEPIHVRKQFLCVLMMMLVMGMMLVG